MHLTILIRESSVFRLQLINNIRFWPEFVYFGNLQHFGPPPLKYNSIIMICDPVYWI